MSDWPTQNMDQLFREGSERHDFEYNPAAWQQMDQLLDEQESRRKWLLWFWLGIGLFVLLLLSASLFFGQGPLSSQQQSNPAKTTNDSALSSTNTQQQQPQHPIQTNLHSDSLVAVNPPTKETNTGELAPQERALSSTSTNGEEKSNYRYPTSIGTKSEKRRTSLKSETPEIPGSSFSGSANVQSLKNANDLHVVNQDKEAIHSAQPSEEQAMPLRVSPDHLPLLPIIVHWSASPPAFPLSDSSSSNSIHPVPKKDVWLLGLSGASEFNSVGPGDYTDMNWKLGVQLEYRFASRWAVKTGLNYIKMWYDAGPGEYTPEMGFWVDGVAPVSTRGQCNMLELPIQVSHHFKGYQQNGFYASAGVASYWITEEHYWYRYDNPPPDPVVYWGTQKDERNWLNIGHVSGGYNLHFSEKWSMQLGPYFQFPLAGVGHGAVDIYSLGFQAIANFKLK